MTASRTSVVPLATDNIRVVRGGRALLDGISLSLHGSSIRALMGPNGAGKSLLLRILANLAKADSGTVLWNGAPPDLSRAVRIGFVLQKPVMLRRTVLANVRFALAATGVPARQQTIRATALLANAHLQHLSAAPARLLSAGEQQRVALVRALACEPEVLLLDEPTANLDPSATAHIETLLREAASHGTLVTLITHDPGQIKRITDEVIFLHRGRVTERTPTGTFLSQPGSVEARAFLDGKLLTETTL